MGNLRNRLHSPDDLVTIYDDKCITAYELFEEWPSCSELYLSRAVESGLLNLFEVRKSYEDTEGKAYHHCLKLKKVLPDPSETVGPTYDWEHKVFYISEIKSYENEHPTLRHNPINFDDIQNGPFDYISYFKKNPDEWIQAEKVRRQLKISPFKFRELLERAYFETEQEEGRGQHYADNGSYAEPYFQQEEIPSLSIHISSYKEYCEQHNLDPYLLPDRQPKPPTPPTAYTTKLAEAQNEIKKLKDRITELKEQKTPAIIELTETPKPKTAPAVKGAAAKRADEWKACLEEAVDLFVKLCEKGSDQFSSTELERFAERNGFKWSKTQLNTFRKAMPAFLVKKTSGTPSK